MTMIHTLISEYLRANDAKKSELVATLHRLTDGNVSNYQNTQPKPQLDAGWMSEYLCDERFIVTDYGIKFLQWLFEEACTAQWSDSQSLEEFANDLLDVAEFKADTEHTYRMINPDLFEVNLMYPPMGNAGLAQLGLVRKQSYPQGSKHRRLVIESIIDIKNRNISSEVFKYRVPTATSSDGLMNFGTMAWTPMFEYKTTTRKDRKHIEALLIRKGVARSQAKKDIHTARRTGDWTGIFQVLSGVKFSTRVKDLSQGLHKEIVVKPKFTYSHLGSAPQRSIMAINALADWIPEAVIAIPKEVRYINVPPNATPASTFNTVSLNHNPQVRDGALIKPPQTNQPGVSDDLESDE